MKIFDNIRDYFTAYHAMEDSFTEDFYIVRFKDFLKKEEEHTVSDRFSEPHKRGFFELTLLRRHSAIMNIGDRAFENVSNSLAAISPYQMISIGKNASQLFQKPEIDGYVIFFKHSFFSSIKRASEIQVEFPFFKVHTTPLYQLTKEQMGELSAVAEKMYDECYGDKLHKSEMIRSLLLILLYQTKRITHDNDNTIAVNRFELITSKFEQCISGCGTPFLSVADYASKLNISAIYLSECVKKATGKNAQQVIIDYKMLHAKALLQQTDKTISQIAMDMGFNEDSNFTKFFKRHSGETPKVFRKKG